jgi:hypothetical protein
MELVSIRRIACRKWLLVKFTGLAKSCIVVAVAPDAIAQMNNLIVFAAKRTLNRLRPGTSLSFRTPIISREQLALYCYRRWTRGKVRPIGHILSDAERVIQSTRRALALSNSHSLTRCHDPQSFIALFSSMTPSSDMQLDSPVSIDDITEGPKRRDRQLKRTEKSGAVSKQKQVKLGEREWLTPDGGLAISRPVTTVIDTANSLLYAINGTNDFAFRYRLVSKAMAIGRNLSNEIINPLSVIRPSKPEVQSTKRLLLLSHSAMIQILVQEDYMHHRELIYDHLHHVILLLGQRMIYDPLPGVSDAIWPHMLLAINSQGWPIGRRLEEYLRSEEAIPETEYYVFVRLYATYMSMSMEMKALEACIEEGNIEEAKGGVAAMEVSVRIINEALDLICSGRIPKYFYPPHPKWDHPEAYQKLTKATLERFRRCKRDVEVKSLLEQGDALLSLAVRGADEDYFVFQAKLALNTYRAAYRTCQGHEERNFGLEEASLQAMKQVLDNYLGEFCPVEMIVVNVDRVLGCS